MAVNMLNELPDSIFNSATAGGFKHTMGVLLSKIGWVSVGSAPAWVDRLPERVRFNFPINKYLNKEVWTNSEISLYLFRLSDTTEIGRVLDCLV